MLVTSCREKVVTRKDSDFRGTPTLLSFSKNGKVLCVAGRCGLLCTLNIEDNTVTHAYMLPRINTQSDIISLSWQAHESLGTRLNPLFDSDLLMSLTWGPLDKSENEVDGMGYSGDNVFPLG
mgnify:CR=1 FL=1